MSIHLMPPEQLKSVVSADVDGTKEDEEDVEKILADIAKSSETVKPFLDKNGTRRVEESAQNERSISKTKATKHRDRYRSTNEDSDEESEDEAPQGKKKK